MIALRYLSIRNYALFFMVEMPSHAGHGDPIPARSTAPVFHPAGGFIISSLEMDRFSA
jgi:hypothetical protein